VIPERYREEVKLVHHKILTSTSGFDEYAENSIVTRNGKERIIGWHTTILLDRSGQIVGLLSSGSDITEKKELEKVEEEQRLELEIYTSLMRHDLRNDLGVILGYIDIGRMIAGEGDSEFVELMNSTEAVTTRMTNLLRVFGKSAVAPETNLVKLVRSTAQLAKEADLHLEINVEASADAENIEVSSSRLLPMVFDNLFRNAAVHAGENPVVTVKIGRLNDFVEIVVSDNGPGIAEEVRDRLFQRGVSTRGGGLGLYLTKQIVQSKNGFIEVADYKQGEGAAFIIKLPIKQ
jgi:signal transduction histidine kinase